jgi:hypothetical protein
MSGDGCPRSSPLHEDRMPRGLPRPRSRDGLPVPYIARGPDELGQVEAMRRALCVLDRRCQVCGDPLGDESVVVFRPGDQFVIDGAALHPSPCWPMARELCPLLVDLAAEGRLEVRRVATSSLDAASASDGYRTPLGASS